MMPCVKLKKISCLLYMKEYNLCEKEILIYATRLCFPTMVFIMYTAASERGRGFDVGAYYIIKEDNGKGLIKL